MKRLKNLDRLLLILAIAGLTSCVAHGAASHAEMIASDLRAQGFKVNYASDIAPGVGEFGEFDTQGRRNEMEDEYLADPEHKLFGIFDGHGGKAFATLVKTAFVDQFD